MLGQGPDHLLLHGVGLLAIGGILLGVRLLGRQDPVFEYRLLVGVLVGTLLVPILQLLVFGRLPAAGPGPPLRDAVRALVPAAEVPARVAAPAVPDHAPRFPPPGVLPAATSRTASPAASTGADLIRFAGPAYLAGVLLLLAFHAGRLRRTLRVLRRAERVTTPAVAAAWHRVAGGSPLRHRVGLRVSDQVDAPACWGVLRPVIVIPARRTTPSPALDWALLHELVHLERRDPWTALLQAALTTLFWFHPVAWCLSRRLDHLREVSCDLLVVRRAGNRRSYALALLDHAAPAGADAGMLAPPRLGPPAHLLHWSRSARQLRRRIEMLFLNQKPVSRRGRYLCGAAIGVAVACVWAGQLALAAAEDGEHLVARCDGKNKSKERPRFTVPPPAAPARTPAPRPEVDIGRLLQPPADAALANPTWVSGAVAFDADIRAALLRTLQTDANASVRAAAAHALAPWINDDEVKRGFLEALRQSRSDAHRATILDALLRREAISTDVKDVLVGVFAGDGDDDVARRSVAEALSPYAGRTDTRQVLIHALEQESAVVQLNAAEALAPHAAEPAVRDALLRTLAGSENEVARMVMIDALAPLLPESGDVRELFLTIVERDDNEVARMAATRALAGAAEGPRVREALVRGLLGRRNDVVKMAFAEALAPYANEPAVKRTFIELIPKLGSEVIRMRMVTALARVIEPGSPGWPDAPGRPRSLPQAKAADVVPIRDTRGS